MILDPTTDAECLGQITQMARELAPTTLIRDVAQHLGSARAVIAWLQSLPQSDDDGHEHVRAISCDVWQRVRLFPDDPNCFERAFAALTLLEVLEPTTARMLVTIDRPLRHTGVVEKRAGHWIALDLFPRRNSADWAGYGITGLQGAHQYVGKPLLKFYLGDTGGKVADALGEQEAKLAANQRKPAPKKNGKPATPVQRPPVAGTRPAVVAQRPKSVAPVAAAQLITNLDKGGGQRDEESESERQSALPPTAAGIAELDGDESADADAFGTEAETQRWGWR